MSAKLNKKFLSRLFLILSIIFSINSNVYASSPANSDKLSTTNKGLYVVAFNKVTPANGSVVNLPANSYRLLTWTDALAESSDRYQYCFDKTNNNTCDGGNWVTRDSLYSGGPGDFSLEPSTTYYWQVRLRDNGLSADAGTWWSFTTSAYAGPTFNKTNPANGTVFATMPSTYHLLQWSDLGISESDRYIFCIDNSNNNKCDSTWFERKNLYSGTDEFYLSYGKTYYWQVKVRDSGIEADGGVWHSFSISSAGAPTLNKTFPANGTTYSTIPSTYHLLQWTDLQISETDRYMYCVDTSNNNNCDTAWHERPNLYSGTGEFSLSYGNTYYWQVKARDNGTVADGGTWRSFTIEPFYPSPYVVSINRASADNPGNGVSVDFTVTFSQSVTGVDASDFIITTTGTVANTSITNVNGSGTTWTVTINSGDTPPGTIRLDLIDDDTIQNVQLSFLGGTGNNNGNFTSGQVYTKP